MISSAIQAEPLSYYFDENVNYDADIPTPKSVTGFEIGDRHVRHDQLVYYFDALARSSDKVKLEDMGLTNEHRRQLLVTISSEENLSKLDEIYARRQLDSAPNEDDPVIIWLGYSVHGDEISGANASLLVAYYLAASDDAEVQAFLDKAIIVLEPSINPDGMDRFTTWVTSHRGKTANGDPQHMEHFQAWPKGRTNHYMFDLNRDWLLLTQQETKNRMPFFHRIKPNVVADFHEMGAHSTYFFQPGVPSRTNPLTPKTNIDLTHKLARFHADALDSDNRLYFTEELFDDFYYGKGSTYPDINGAVGILFEQGSTRGYQQETTNGTYVFGFGVKNHVLTSFSTIRGAVAHADELKKFRKNFYQDSIEQAKDEKFAGYLVSEAHDPYRLEQLLELLKGHQIKYHSLSEDAKINGQKYKAEHSYFIPLVQPQYKLVKAIFSSDKSFPDNTFYDVSGWTIPLAMNIDYVKVKRQRDVDLTKEQPVKTIDNAPLSAAYAYAFRWDHYLAPKLLNQLLVEGIKVKVASKSFTLPINGQMTQFHAGDIVIPTGIQTLEQASVVSILDKASKATDIAIEPLTTGLTDKGIDIGSRSLVTLKAPKVLIVGGQGVAPGEVGELQFYLDDILGIPVSVIEHARLSRSDLSRYSHIFLVNSYYPVLTKSASEKLEDWVKRGGVLFGQKSAINWLSDNDILAASIVDKATITSAFDTSNLSYGDRDKLRAKSRIAGAIFTTELDTSHPLGYGYRNENLALFKNSNSIIEKPEQPFVTVASYHSDPLASGYTAKELVDLVKNNAAIVAHNVGKGKVIASTDNLAFRGYWLGSHKIIANALFFGKMVNASAK